LVRRRVGLEGLRIHDLKFLDRGQTFSGTNGEAKMGDVIEMRTRRTMPKSAPVVPIRKGKFRFDMYETPSGLMAIDAVVPMYVALAMLQMLTDHR
jgi:hypothetical protein